MRNIIIGGLALVALAGCGEATAPVASSTPAPTQAPVPVQTYNLACTYVLTYQGSEIGITLQVPSSKLDSATGCRLLRTSLDSINSQAGSLFAISENDGTAIDFTSLGGDIVQACASKDNTVKVYQHSKDQISVTLAIGVCSGIKNADTGVAAA